MLGKPSLPVAYYGAIVNPETLDSYSLWPRALIVLDSKGNIALIEEDVEPSKVTQLLSRRGLDRKAPLIRLRSSEFLLPGFVDTHTVRILQFSCRKSR